MSAFVVAVTENSLKTMALGISGGSLVVALILLKVVRSIVGKIVSVALLVGVAFAGYTQRQSLSDCADKVRTSMGSSAASGQKSVKATCTFFGRDFTIDVDIPVG